MSIYSLAYASDCEKSYFESPFSKYITLEFKEKIKKYCKCEDYKVKDWIDYSYSSKDKMLLNKDYCASKFYSSEEIEVHYTIKYHEYYIPKILSKLNDITNPATAVVVGHDRWENYKNCFLNIITTQCSKTKSLTSTNTCINNNFDLDEFYKNHKECSEMKQIVFDEMMI